MKSAFKKRPAGRTNPAGVSISGAVTTISLPMHSALTVLLTTQKTLRSQGWNGMTNGELLRLAERERFDVMVTADQGIEFQQNLSKAGVGIVVVRTSSNRMEHLLPLVGQIVEAIEGVSKATVVRVGA